MLGTSSFFARRTGCAPLFLLVRGRVRAATGLPAIFFLSFMAALLFASLQAHADVTWTLSPSQTGDWSVASNWGGILPTGTDNAWVVNGGIATITQLGETCGTLSLGGTAGSGTVWMTGGGLYGPSWASYEYVGNSGSGTFIQSAGNNSTGTFGSLNLGQNVGSNGTYSLIGGALSASSEDIGSSGTGIFTQSGGSNSAGSLTIGNNSGSNGTYSLSGNGQVGGTWEYVGSLRHWVLNAVRRKQLV